jgi:hypothetical protein
MIGRSRATIGMLNQLFLLLAALAGKLVSGATSRQLHQVSNAEYPQLRPKVERLEDACGIKDFAAFLTEGENCILSKSVVAKYEELVYTFSIPPEVAKKLNMEIVFEPFEGKAELCAPLLFSPLLFATVAVELLHFT